MVLVLGVPICRSVRVSDAYHLVATDNCHNRQRLNANRCGIKSHVAALAALVAEHDVGVNVCVEVLDALLVAGDGILEGCLVLGILGAVTAAVSGAESAVAVNIHVDQVAAGALEVHDTVVAQVVTAVGEV